MTADTENLVLDLRRGMRADLSAFRSDLEKRFMSIETRLGAIGEHVEGIETRLEGWRCVFVAATGALVTAMKDHGTRIAALEGARA